MVAIYARQSVEKTNSISIDTQIEACKERLKKGEEFIIFSDKGYSGKNTVRPGLQQMMRQIESGKITKVIVYKLDRISRSLVDFIMMTDRFSESGVAFASCNEEFDTATSMGKAIMRILAVFAQLERETIQLRVKDAYRARSQKGFFMGGRVPYGFRTEKAVVDGVNTSRFIKDEEEAAVIMLIFSMYADEKTSLGDVVRVLSEKGITKYGKPWQRGRVSDILKNPVYVRADTDIWQFFIEQGAVVINEPEQFNGVNGCYYFSGDDAAARKQTSYDGNIVVVAPHEGIVPSSLWLKCRRKLFSNGIICAKPKAKNTWLAGKIKCGICGYALSDKHFTNRNSRYLICSHKMNSGACSGPSTIHTDEVEEQVFLAIKSRLAEFEVLHGEVQKKTNPEIAALNTELIKLGKELDGYIKRIPQANDLLFDAINREATRIEKRRMKINAKLNELNALEENDLYDIKNHIELWNTLPFDGRKKVVHAMIKRITASNNGINIEWSF